MRSQSSKRDDYHVEQKRQKRSPCLEGNNRVCNPTSTPSTCEKVTELKPHLTNVMLYTWSSFVQFCSLVFLFSI